MIDPSRQPEGKETAWAYTHVPQRVRGDAGGSLTGRWDQTELDELAERCERAIERIAPGFRSLVRRRRVLGPSQLQQSDGNLVGGALNGGTAQVHQQVVFPHVELWPIGHADPRPLPRLRVDPPRWRSPRRTRARSRPARR
jgi:phytoene dehydrogenase-like protein